MALDASRLRQFRMTLTALCAHAPFNVPIVPSRMLKSPGKSVWKCNTAGPCSKPFSQNVYGEHEVKCCILLQDTLAVWRTLLKWTDGTADSCPAFVSAT